MSMLPMEVENMGKKPEHIRKSEDSSTDRSDSTLVARKDGDDQQIVKTTFRWFLGRG